MSKTTGIAQFAVGRQDLHRIDPRQLVITDGWNNRDDNAELTEHIETLAQSIAEIGVRKAIEVKLENGQLIVKDGHCRTKATMLAISRGADIKSVPVISVDRYASDEDLILNQVISNSGKPLSPIEEARVYKKLIDLGWKQADIAKKVGKSSGRISQIMGILVLPAVVQSAVAEGVVSASLATASFTDATTANADLAEAVEKAKARGASRVSPADLNAPAARKFDMKTALGNCEFDDENMQENGFATIKMPIEEYLEMVKYYKL